MYRRYISTRTRELLNIARSPSSTVALLQEIMAELAERKNEYAFRGIFEVGKLLEQAQEKELREIEERRRAERQHLLQRNLEGYFNWPSTDAPASIHGFSGDVFFYEDGLLSYVGYRVGRVNGAPEDIRLQILDCVFHNDLPRVISPEYMEEWSTPKTAARLHKMADTLAAFARNAKRRKDSDLSEAIVDWESDLFYLFHRYYIGRFGFAWPNPDLLE